MNKQNPRYFQRGHSQNRNMHDEMSRQRHFRPEMKDYGLRSNQIHTPSSGFSYSDSDAYEADRAMNPNVRYVPGEPNRETVQRLSYHQSYDDSNRMDDADISDFVYEVLARHPEIDVSQIDIETRNKVVILEGLVETRRLKRLIEDVIYGLPPIRDVQNRLEVLPPDRDRRRIAHSLT